MDLFLYDRDLRLERVKNLSNVHYRTFFVKKVNGLTRS